MRPRLGSVMAVLAIPTPHRAAVIGTWGRPSSGKGKTCCVKVSTVFEVIKIRAKQQIGLVLINFAHILVIKFIIHRATPC